MNLPEPMLQSLLLHATAGAVLFYFFFTLGAEARICVAAVLCAMTGWEAVQGMTATGDMEMTDILFGVFGAIWMEGRFRLADSAPGKTRPEPSGGLRGTNTRAERPESF